ncbi:MAG: 4-alpha-glucanotransferase, partial [Chloroflexota bacterium]|nr:4-alpha-glucanotransferase [Chloroflexota bacterium]
LDDPHASGLDPVRVARPGARLPAAGELTLEDGTQLGAVKQLPFDLPLGYHRLVLEAGEQLLIAAPRRCFLPDQLRIWAWATQLYATRSSRSWGIGDLADLRSLASWARGLGAGALVVNPLGAPNPGPKVEASPYYPSTRRYGDPLLVAIDAVPGADRVAESLRPLADAGRDLNRTRRMDRDRALQIKLAALGAIWSSGAARSGATTRRLAAFRDEQGEALRQWATFVMLSERLGTGWQSWPEPYRDPASPAVARAAAEGADRVAFHEWIQWLIDEQLAAAAGAGPFLIADLPVGFDRDGFDAWVWQGSLALGMSVGAPPDPFTTEGQEWGLPPFIPQRLREEGYRPFIETLRAVLRHAGGLRIDHVLGLFRLWWVPRGVSAASGVYVRSATYELLAILALESHRASALVIGEDLGVVESGVRQTLRSRNVLSTRLAYFERRKPSAYPRPVMASVTTHDLPTVAGVWSGADLADQARAGVTPNVGGDAAIRARMSDATGLRHHATASEVIMAAYGALARSDAALVVASLEDAARVEERPNLPGTTARQRPNWSLALPVPIEELQRDPFVERLGHALRR